MTFNRRQKVICMALWLVIGIISGAWIAQNASGSFQTPEPLVHPWRTIEEGHDKDAEIKNGAHIVDGALTITKHVSNRSDTLVPEIEETSKIAKVNIELAPDSDTVQVVLGGGEKHFVFFAPGKVRPSPGHDWFDIENDVFTLMVRDGTLMLKDNDWIFPIGPSEPGGLEITTKGQQARIYQIGFFGENDSWHMTTHFTKYGVSNSTLLIGIALGAMIGLCSGLFICSGVHLYTPFIIAIMWLLPIYVSSISRIEWMHTVESFYLTKSVAWEVSRLVLAVCLLPSIVIGVLSSGILSLHRYRRRVRKKKHQLSILLWVVAAISALFFGYDGASAWYIAPMIIFVFMPLTVMFRSQFKQPMWFVFDALSLFAIGLMGWHSGFIISAIWRLTVLMAASRALLKWGKKPAADYLFVLILAFPVGLEALISDTYLHKQWDPRVLGLEQDSDGENKVHKAEWKGACGNLKPEEKYRIIYTGGSSTGGAYEHADEPGTFFGPQAHNMLCKRMPKTARLETLNFAQADYNTHTISTEFQSVLDAAPDLVIMYLGVNDFSPSSITRKMRQAEKDSRSSSLNTISGFARRSRLVSFGSLLLNKEQGESQKKTVEVPIEDAKENLHAIADKLEGSAKLLLLTELIISDEKDKMIQYQEMQMDVADQRDHVHYFDIRKRYSDEEINDMILPTDRNHLTREGHKELAQLLLTPIGQTLSISLNDTPIATQQDVPSETSPAQIAVNQTAPQAAVNMQNNSVPDKNEAMIIEKPPIETIESPSVANAKDFVPGYVVCPSVEMFNSFMNAVMEANQSKQTAFMSNGCINPKPGARGIVIAKQGVAIQVEFNHNGDQLRMWTGSGALR